MKLVLRLGLLSLCMILNPVFADSEFCDISNDPKNADTEEMPLSDYDFMADAALRATNSIDKFVTESLRKLYEEKPEIKEFGYIPQNDLVVIKGYILISELQAKKNWFDKLKQEKDMEFSIKKAKQEYEEAKKQYCDFRSKARLIDW